MNRYILLLLLFVQGLYAQVEFKAVPSKTTLGVNERLRVDFVMNADGDNFVPPSFNGFRAQGPGQTISNTWINRKQTFSKSYNYILTPTSRGEFTIGSASIEINGKIYKTAPVKITVTDPVKVHDYGQPIQDVGEGIHLVAEVSKSNPYVNEAINVVYKLYVSPNVSVRNWQETESPKYNDFWSQSERVESKNLVVQQGVYNGENYRYVVLQRTVLYPQKSGRLEIEPLMLDITMEAPTGRRGFGQQLYMPVNKVVSAGKKYVNVRPLPENNQPESFTGSVGKFDFTVKPSKTRLHGDETLQLEVAVSGKGNLKLFTLPKPVVPSALEMYDPEHKENISVPLSGMQGTISDVYVISPQNKGKYPIKPLTFSYFDPSTGSYKTITSKEIMIDVLDNPTGENDATASNQTGKQQVKPSEQFRFVDLETSLLPMQRDDFFGSGLFYVLFFAPFLLIPIIILAKRKKEAFDSDVVGNKIRQNNRLARKYLSEAKKHLGNKEPFYVALERALHNFLKAKLNIETSEMRRENIEELLLSRNAHATTVNDFFKIMDSCEFARYAPSSGAAMQQDYESAVSVITALEKQI